MAEVEVVPGDQLLQIQAADLLKQPAVGQQILLRAAVDQKDTGGPAVEGNRQIQPGQGILALGRLRDQQLGQRLVRHLLGRAGELVPEDIGGVGRNDPIRADDAQLVGGDRGELTQQFFRKMDVEFH